MRQSVWLFSLLTIAVAGWAQQPTEPQVGSLDQQFQHYSTGDEIPRFLVVRTFFKVGTRQVRHAAPEVLHAWLVDLGIEANSQAADVLVDSILAAEALMERPTHDFTLKGEAYERYKARETRRLAVDLASHFARLEAALAREGFAPFRLHAYLNERIRSGMMLASTEEGPSDLMVSAELEFANRLDALRAELGGSKEAEQ